MIDAEARFKQAVIDEFAASYAVGETPVPCVRCNQGPKFTDLLNMARELGAAALATGHYVRRVEGPGGAELHRAADAQRDQSWFLFATTRSQLEFCRFPLGDMPDKAATRSMAARFGLAVADKPDSQDICFVPHGSYAELVGQLQPTSLQAGEIVTQDGRVLGQHQGIARYTVGQAKRLGDASRSGGTPQVVLALEPATRRIVVGPRDAGTRQVRLREMNWLVDAPASGIPCTVKLRAHDRQRLALVVPTDSGADVHLDDVALPAPGQGCVLYAGDRVLGGGFIARS